MRTRVAIARIIVEDPTSVPALNELPHEFSRHVIGRMASPAARTTST